MRGAGQAVAIAAALMAPACAPRFADPFAWTPPDAPAVTRGRQVASRFDLLSLTEVAVEVDNAFAAGSRDALAAAEQRLAEVPGVRRVIGPAGLLELRIDAAGKPSARPVLTRGTSEGQSEAARQRVVRRADALGWFLSANGRIVRFLIDAPDFERARPGIEAALGASGLGLVRRPSDGGTEARALWPDPRGHGARWLPAAMGAGWVLFVLLAGLQLGPSVRRDGRLRRAHVAGLVAGTAAATVALFAAVPIAGVRAAGIRAATATVVVLLLALGVEGRSPPARGERRWAGRPPLTGLVLSLLVVAAAGVLAARLRVGTRQWSDAPLMFVSVRGDLDEPVVLREVRRLTDFLRAQPGVANAWSIADLFQGTLADGEEASRIPDEPDEVRRVLVEARLDPAVRLELAGDHREALVGVRFDEESAEGSADRLELVDRLAFYLATDLRRALIHVDLRTPWVSPPTRAVARSLMASDTEERVTRICARSGRPVSAAEAMAVRRAARMAATLPSVDEGRFQTEVREMLARQPPGLPQAQQERLVEILRRRHTARINFREMLYGADLPTEGVLADEVRGATLEAMDPVVGVPVAPGTAAAFSIDAAPVGGAANEHALSEAWGASLRAGSLTVASAMALLLLVMGGGRGAAWLPVGLAPAAVAVLPAEIVREPLGLWSLSFIAGALAAGALTALALARRGESP